MQQTYKQAIRSFVLALMVMMIATISVQAQGPDTFDEPTPAQDVPIDGGVSLLLAGTAAYGIKRMKANKLRKH